MKRCPTCNRSYSDDTLSFCLEDGTRLAPDYDPEATIIAQPRPPSAQPQSSNRRAYQFTILLLLLLLGTAGIGLYVAFSSNNGGMQAAATPSPEPSRGDPLSLLNQNTSVKASPTPTPTPNDQPAIPKIYDKTYDVARRVLIKAGWLPNKRLPIHGQDVEVQSGNGPTFWQRGYWELEACSGTGSANCVFEFIDPTGRLLGVVTEGEEDEAGTYHARVSRVYLKKKS